MAELHLAAGRPTAAAAVARRRGMPYHEGLARLALVRALDATDAELAGTEAGGAAAVQIARRGRQNGKDGRVTRPFRRSSIGRYAATKDQSVTITGTRRPAVTR